MFAQETESETLDYALEVVRRNAEPSRAKGARQELISRLHRVRRRELLDFGERETKRIYLLFNILKIY